MCSRIRERSCKRTRQENTPERLERVHGKDMQVSVCKYEKPANQNWGTGSFVLNEEFDLVGA